MHGDDPQRCYGEGGGREGSCLGTHVRIKDFKIKKKKAWDIARIRLYENKTNPSWTGWPDFCWCYLKFSPYHSIINLRHIDSIHVKMRYFYCWRILELELMFLFYIKWQKLWKILKERNTRLPDLALEKLICRSGSNSENWTWNNRLLPNRKRSTSRLYVVTLLI